MRDWRDGVARLTVGLSMAAILLSSVDGRAIGSADAHVDVGFRHFLARSSRRPAYSRAGTCCPSTASSHACSLSRRRRVQANQMSGLNQSTARTTSAPFERASRAAGCAPARGTARHECDRRSTLARERAAGRSVSTSPRLRAGSGASVWSSAIGRVSPCDFATASAIEIQRSSCTRSARAEVRPSLQIPPSRSTPVTAMPAAQPMAARVLTSMVGRPAGVSRAVVVVTETVVETGASLAEYEGSSTVHPGNQRLSGTTAAAPKTVAASTTCRSAADRRERPAWSSSPLARTTEERSARSAIGIIVIHSSRSRRAPRSAEAPRL